MTTTSPDRGPYLLAALICEKVLEEKDGVKSAIRIIDRITRTEITADPQKRMEPFNWMLQIFVSLKAGGARGPARLRIRMVKPSGESPRDSELTVHFEGGEDHGVDAVVNANLTFEWAGIYWFEIYLDDVFLTKVPFRIIYLPQRPQ